MKLRSDPPPLPKGVESRTVRFEPALEPPRRELFIAGTAQDVIRANATTLERLGGAGSKEGLARIAYPGEGTIIGLDPDIPPANQRVLFKASSRLPAGWTWQLDGKRQPALAWFPMPGKHHLQLLDAHGNEADAVAFEVRGAVFKPGAIR